MGYECQASARFTSLWLSSAPSAPQFVSGALQLCCEDPLTSKCPCLSEEHSAAQNVPVPGRRQFPRNQLRFILFPCITWLLVKPLVGNFQDCHPVSIAQGGQLHFVTGNFISAVDLKFNTRECLKVRSKKSGRWGIFCHLHILFQHMAVSVDANCSHS